MRSFGIAESNGSTRKTRMERNTVRHPTADTKAIATMQKSKVLQASRTNIPLRASILQASSGTKIQSIASSQGLVVGIKAQ